jgi:group II intron reverse transcriptase/maturase
MERIVERSNVVKALKRVEQNKGSPGIDGMTVQELRPYLRKTWPHLREKLLTGDYRPERVREQQIPKSGGGVRKLGIPTVLDRFIQQAILQVLQPHIDPTFSEGSYGFRPSRSAHQAVRTARQHVQEGKTWVVDVDLEAFFDRVNHDILMGKLSKRIGDRRLLGLVRRYLEAGTMVNGVVVERYEGTPQGGPLSPLLANVLLDSVDKALEKRGLAFVRYADDCNVYVQSRRAAEDAMQTMRRLVEALRLRVNEAKSAVDRPWNRTFLGYSMWWAGRTVKLRVAPKALDAMKERARRLTRRNGGRSMEMVIAELRSFLTGWRTYFALSETPGVFDELDKWVRHRLRTLQLKQWKRGRTAYRELRRLGVNEAMAGTIAKHLRSWWANAARVVHAAMPRKYFDALGLPRLAR